MISDTKPLNLTKWAFLQIPFGQWTTIKNVQFVMHEVDDGCILYQAVVNGEKMSAKLGNRKAAFVFHKLIETDNLFWTVKG